MSVLTEVDARNRAAAGVVITHHVVAWSAMRDTVRILRELRRGAAEGVSRALEDLVDLAGAWLRSVNAAPLEPSHALVGTAELAATIRDHDASGLDPHLGAQFRRLAELLDALADEPHPAARCLEEVVCRYGRLDAADPAGVYVVAQAHEIHLVEAWLSLEGLDAEVRSPHDLRGAAVRNALVLLGPPSRYFTSAWCSPGRAARIGGWLLSAPPARRVHVLTWPGHAPFDPATANLFPNTAVLPVCAAASVGDAAPGVAPGETTAQDDAIWLPPKPVAARIAKVGAWAGDRDPVPATGMRLAGERIVFYSSGIEPHPESVTWDLATAAVENVTPERVRVGTALLFRPLRSATDDELHRRADAILATRRGPGAPAAARAAKAELKAAFADAQRSARPLHPWLATKLGDAAYARHILNRLLDPAYIAPEKPGAYQALRTVLGLSSDTDGSRQALLAALRGACRHAGIEITRELIDVLRLSTGWQRELEADGHVTISGGPLLGCLDIRAVTAVDRSPRRVGRSRIGRLMRITGSPRDVVTPIDTEETT